jgi:3,4-dihydroxy 2-butanone 4-phosphate synthase / GTP cyclohydrolase II
MNNTENQVNLILNDIKSGKPVIIVDSYDRENEGDIMIAAEMATPESLAFMARYARGIMCVPCIADRLDRLSIPMMQSNKLDKFVTPFANSIDAADGVSTGVSINDRLITIQKFVSETSVPTDFAQPGHLFPLRARPGLLKERQGHTESSVELCLLAGMKPVAIIIEVMNDDGSMARLPQLEELAKKFELNMISIDEIIEHKYGTTVQHTSV